MSEGREWDRQWVCAMWYCHCVKYLQLFVLSVFHSQISLLLEGDVEFEFWYWNVWVWAACDVTWFSPCLSKDWTLNSGQVFERSVAKRCQTVTSITVPSTYFIHFLFPFHAVTSSFHSQKSDSSTLHFPPAVPTSLKNWIISYPHELTRTLPNLPKSFYAFSHYYLLDLGHKNQYMLWSIMHIQGDWVMLNFLETSEQCMKKILL